MNGVPFPGITAVSDIVSTYVALARGAKVDGPAETLQYGDAWPFELVAKRGRSGASEPLRTSRGARGRPRDCGSLAALKMCIDSGAGVVSATTRKIAAGANNANFAICLKQVMDASAARTCRSARSNLRRRS